MPDLPPTEGWQSQALFLGVARRENLTLRQLYQRVATARGHWTVVGTPQSIADELSTGSPRRGGWLQRHGAHAAL